MPLWTPWTQAVDRLRPAFRRNTTFLWFLAALAALSLRQDLAGVTSFVRSLGFDLKEGAYNSFRRLFHSSAVCLGTLCRLWAGVCLDIFGPYRVEVDEKPVLICDGIKSPKEGRKMPAVKSLHQESSNNSKPAYIMGHSWQVISLLVRATQTFLAVPLVAGIGEGLVFSNRDQRTQLDFLISLLESLAITQPFYLLADAYYACRKIARALVGKGCHLISRMRITAVAYEPAAHPSGKRGRGRPRFYGDKVKLKTLFDRPMMETESPYPGEKGVLLHYVSVDLIWRPLGRLARFVAVKHPHLGRRLFFSTDLTRPPAEIIRIYSWRFKIEVSFRQAIHVLGVYAYHFWMKIMKPIKKRSGDQYLHKTSDTYRDQVKKKIKAYELHVQIGIIAQGMMHYLACACPLQVWQCFRGWIKTIRPGLPPSELVVAQALRDSFPEFLMTCPPDLSLKKFLADKINSNNFQKFKQTG